jgi:peptide/nickel transport system permease protein
MATEADRAAPVRAAERAQRAWWRRALDSDLFWSFRRSPVTVAAALITLGLVGAALLVIA